MGTQLCRVYHLIRFLSNVKYAVSSLVFVTLTCFVSFFQRNSTMNSNQIFHLRGSPCVRLSLSVNLALIPFSLHHRLACAFCMNSFCCIPFCEFTFTLYESLKNLVFVFSLYSHFDPIFR